MNVETLLVFVKLFQNIFKRVDYCRSIMYLQNARSDNIQILSASEVNTHYKHR